MLRITKNTGKISSIRRIFMDCDDHIDIDSFLIIPGVTAYVSIYSIGNSLKFIEVSNNSIIVEFNSEGDLERFFTQLMRDIKLNQITNVNVESKKS